jgi:hypothetical protein
MDALKPFAIVLVFLTVSGSALASQKLKRGQWTEKESHYLNRAQQSAKRRGRALQLIGLSEVPKGRFFMKPDGGIHSVGRAFADEDESDGFNAETALALAKRTGRTVYTTSEQARGAVLTASPTGELRFAPRKGAWGKPDLRNGIYYAQDLLAFVDSDLRPPVTLPLADGAKVLVAFRRVTYAPARGESSTSATARVEAIKKLVGDDSVVALEPPAQ